MPVVDAHHHLWDPRVRDYPFLAGAGMESIRRPYGLDELRERCRTHGVSQTVLVQTVPSMEETREFLSLAERSEGLIGGVVGWVDLESEGVADAVAGLRAAPGGRHLVGVRHQAQDEPDPAWLARPRVIEGLHRIAEAGLAFDLLVTPPQLAAAVDAASAVPEGRFVLDHIAKPSLDGSDLDAWMRGIRALAALPHVTGKLSGLVSLAIGRPAGAVELGAFTDPVLELFGPARLMFGSDWPVCDAVSGYGEVLSLADWLTADLGKADRDRLFAGTAREFYRLEG